MSAAIAASSAAGSGTAPIGRELVDELADALVILLTVVDLADCPGAEITDELVRCAMRKSRAALHRLAAERPSYWLGRRALA